LGVIKKNYSGMGIMCKALLNSYGCRIILSVGYLTKYLNYGIMSVCNYAS
jgi:hypothetical protein